MELSMGQTMLAMLGSALAGILVIDRCKTVLDTDLRSAMLQLFEIVALLGLVFFAENARIFSTAERHFDGDFFLFVLIAVLLVGLLNIIPNSVTSDHFPRELSDEWKGWMQIVLLMYHFTHATPAYNAVRVLVSSYIWLSCWGHSQYFLYKSKPTWKRLFQVLWRFNFLTVMLMVTTGNTYITYYFSFLITVSVLFTFVFFALNIGITTRICVAGLFCVVVWDAGMFRPLSFFAGFNVHEVHFRTYLDHFTPLSGIVSAIISIKSFKWCRGSWMLVWMGVVGSWTAFVLFQPTKSAYNALHPYTTIIPILTYVQIRSLYPSHHIAIFRFIGSISIELYLLQHHVWLNQNAKSILVLLPGYPLLNLLITTIIFVLMSFRFSHLTKQLYASICIPRVSICLGILVVCVCIIYMLVA